MSMEHSRHSQPTMSFWNKKSHSSNDSTQTNSTHNQTVRQQHHDNNKHDEYYQQDNHEIQDDDGYDDDDDDDDNYEDDSALYCATIVVPKDQRYNSAATTTTRIRTAPTQTLSPSAYLDTSYIVQVDTNLPPPTNTNITMDTSTHAFFNENQTNTSHNNNNSHEIYKDNDFQFPKETETHKPTKVMTTKTGGRLSVVSEEARGITPKNNNKNTIHQNLFDQFRLDPDDSSPHGFKVVPNNYEYTQDNTKRKKPPAIQTNQPTVATPKAETLPLLLSPNVVFK